MVAGSKGRVARAQALVNLPALAALVLWASHATALKLGFRELSPLTLGPVRMALATLLLVTVVVLSGGSLRVARRDLPLLITAGGVGMGLNTVVYHLGVNLTDASIVVLIMTTSPILALLMAWGVGQERFASGRLGGTFLSFAGVALIVGSGASGLAGGQLLGDLLILGAAITWAAYGVAAVSLLRRYRSIVLGAWSLGLSSATSALFGLPSIMAQDWARVGPTGYSVLAFMGFSTAMAMVLWNQGLRRHDASGTYIYMFVSPVLGVLIPFLVLGERLHWLQFLGGALALGGVALTTWRYRAAHRASGAP